MASLFANFGYFVIEIWLQNGVFWLHYLQTLAIYRFGSKIVFFGIIVEKDDDDDDDAEGQQLKSIEDQFYGDESQGVQVKVTVL